MKSSILILSIIFLSIISCQQKNSELQKFILTAQLPTEKVPGYKLIELGQYEANENAIALSPESNFGFTINIQPKPDTYYHVQLKVKSKKYSVNLSSESDWQGWFSSRIPELLNDQNNWYNLHVLVKSPKDSEKHQLKIYAYNWGIDTSYIDSLQVKEYKSFPFSDSLPDFIFNPITYQILNEMAFYTMPVSTSTYLDLLQKALLDTIFISNNIPRENYIKEVKRRIKYNLLDNTFDKIVKETAVLQNPSVSTKKQILYVDSLTGYTEEVVYRQGEEITVLLQNSENLISAELLLPVEDYQFKKIENINFSNKNSLKIATKHLAPNLYCLQIKDLKNTFNIPIIINAKTPSNLILLAPVTTWHAYNHYDGKSFYVNAIDDSCVYEISTQRPLTSCLFDSVFTGHDLYIFQNIYQFFQTEYGCNVYPDSYLESHPELFKEATTIVFAQHCEYFSSGMFDALRVFSQTKNVISLGGNQAYNKIQFKDNFKTIECRKDGTFFSNSLTPAGTWRTSFSNEAQYFGNAYTDAGYATYNSYQVTEPNHWIYRNSLVKNGTEFGQKGIDKRGISGDEMDKVNERTPKNAVILAKGTNPDKGGGDLLIIENSKNAILSFGSIASGSGVNYDPIVTNMLHNFMIKYHKSKYKQGNR